MLNESTMVRECVERCKSFLASHRYSLLEIYSDFEDLIREALEKSSFFPRF